MRTGDLHGERVSCILTIYFDPFQDSAVALRTRLLTTKLPRSEVVAQSG